MSGRGGSGRGGGGRGGGGRRDMPRNQQISRALSRLLRHSAQQEGLTLGKGGYVSVQDVLNTRPLKSIKATFSDIKEVVAENDKQRFSLIPVSSSSSLDDASTTPTPIPEIESDHPSDYLIRANQGHSIKVDTDGLLKPITRDLDNIPAVCVHGTDERAWDAILRAGGLNRMTRNHIHFASGLPAGFKSVVVAADGKGEEDGEVAPPVISGMRKSSTVLVYVDIERAIDEGIKFFVSENGVILSEGDEGGFVPTKLFKRVERRTRGGGVLMVDGKVPEGTVVDVEAWKKDIQESSGGRRGGRGGGRGGRGGGRGGRGGKARVNDDSGDLLAGV
ncbi:hypothetical protein BU24DRAFT_4938 [Aaosphaeria arxii CBS 175.79]|uniref:2'-phosphotransferase n=1 Tax=Aaosphaeria arxii CBS 175.79 TaxID=1450172 RepID=A0A6A5Y5S3_9PLEO|nr:uncharacterized protein BU24DRAFT_4938 [Aaosphaeria arxii CBS 175.79]KAF2020636.1 hypothetical protein BU24DRAFT_4938 [Aaosphaeria arxii CBS 175.79]